MCEPNQAKGQGKVEVFYEVENAVWEGKERLVPCLPGEGHRDTVSQGSSWAPVLSDIPVQGAADLSTCCDTSVFAEPGASLASTTKHLLENMCVKSAKMSKTLLCACRMNLGLSSSFFYIPESKRQACTYLFCTL